MKDWLTSNGMQFLEKALKCELYSLIVSSNPVTVYVIDEIAKAAGCEVLRLPPYHCELNPIEMAWAQVKGYIRVHNTKFTLAHVKELTFAGFAHVNQKNGRSWYNTYKIKWKISSGKRVHYRNRT